MKLAAAPDEPLLKPGRRIDPDWFAVASCVFPLLLLLRMSGAHMGTPVADDYDYIRYAFFERSQSWFDGGGSSVSWRPLARQAYFAIASSHLLTHPRLVALVHLGCLCLAAWLLYRTFRPRFGPATALAVSTGPWLLDSGRMLIAWPSCFQDLGALLFVVIALNEARAGRMATCVIAGGASLLCKEIAAVPLASLIVFPLVPRTRRFGLACALGGLLAVWLTTYAFVVVRQHLLPSPMVGPIEPGKLPLALAQAAWWSLLAIVSAPPSAALVALPVVAILVLLVPWKRVRSAAESSIRDLRSWWVWALLWSIPLILTLVPLLPGWALYRVPLVTLGLVTATTITLHYVHRLAVWGFLLVRLAGTLLASPGATSVSIDPPDHGAALDMPRLARLQHFVSDVRHALTSTHPSLPSHSNVVWVQFPKLTGFAFGGAAAVQVWYRDTTLRWIPLHEWIEDGTPSPAAIVEYEQEGKASAAIVSTEAMKALLAGDEPLRRGAYDIAEAHYRKAQSLQTDRQAMEFLKLAEAKLEFTLAMSARARGDKESARAHVQRVLELYPGDVLGLRVLQSL